MDQGRFVRLSAASLNQWAMDFQGNYERIRESIVQAKQQGARYRFGPELEVTGYCCGDHFFEPDTFQHSWEVVAKLLEDKELYDILIDVGLPVMHRSCRYNCRVGLLNGKVLGIVPKLNLCNDGGNYREMRFFVAWGSTHSTDTFILPDCINQVGHQTSCDIGVMLFSTKETTFAIEVCEDMWTSKSPHVDLALQGAEIIFNSSASHFILKKDWDRRLLAKSASFKSMILYGFCNLHGGDGERLYFEGETFFALNGEIIAMGETFSMKDVQTLQCTVDLHDIRAAKGGSMSSLNAAKNIQLEVPLKFIHTEFSLSCQRSYFAMEVYNERNFLSAEEEITLAPAMWLWDYLRRSGLAGFFLPLSGGIDSCSVACIVAFMCEHVCKEIKNGNQQVVADVRKITGDATFIPGDRKELAHRIFYTCYMGTQNSSDFTRSCAADLAVGIGSSHSYIIVDTVIDAAISVFTAATGLTPRFKLFGGSSTENLAMQNLQARIRMVFSYLFAQLSVYAKTKRERGLLVLGSGNVDEALRGYLTKYDCSSADINPIGGISKTDLRKFISYASTKLNVPVLSRIYNAPPTAELEPLKDGEIQQTDEQDMGMTYDELSLYGRLRKMGKCGPYSMYIKLLSIWKHMTPQEVAAKVQHFFRSYAINRHKQTVLTPSVHLENYSPDDNRFDLRQILYNVAWPWQFSAINRHSEQASNEQ